MPHTNASQSPLHQKLSDAIDCEQQLFLMDFDARSANFSQVIAIILNLIEVNATYRTASNSSHADASTLAINIDDCEVLKTFLLDAIKLSSEYSLQELEWLNEHNRTLRKARKAALDEAAQACAE